MWGSFTYNWGKAPSEEGNLLEKSLVNGAAGQASDVLETSICPVVDDEEGEESGADGIEPP